MPADSGVTATAGAQATGDGSLTSDSAGVGTPTVYTNATTDTGEPSPLLTPLQM